MCHSHRTEGRTRKLQSRLDALERRSGTGLTHCILWSPGISFDDALASSSPPALSTERLLIEMVPVGMDRKPVPMSADEKTEQTKAHAWADGLAIRSI